QALLITTNCGYDTDCTAATLGAMWGLVYGDHFPERWLAPIGEVIRASHGVHDMSMPITLTVLADKIIEVQKKVLKRYAKVSDKTLEKKTLDSLENPWKVSFGSTNELGVDYGGLPVLKGNKKLSFSGKVKDVHVKYPFEAKLKGKTVTLRVDPKAPYTPRHAGVTFEMANGNLHTCALVTPHELYVGKISGPEDFASAVKTDLTELFQKKSLRTLSLDERLFHLRDLKETGWIHLTGYFHLSVFGKYRLAPFSECQVTSFLDGNKIHEAVEGRPCIPAPHRGEKTMVADVELRAGWHRWDIFLNKDKQIRDGKVALTVSDAYTKQLTDFRFHRAPGGVYEH
ncbi:MAG: ADP-ribosylglycohydrolase family protein, partial [Spirochaetia bacterium]|nr:ADP-ribosylglycohydrolase family protein [Spirochaetia bacterium]